MLFLSGIGGDEFSGMVTCAGNGGVPIFCPAPVASCIVMGL